jgi:hypothetical protein
MYFTIVKLVTWHPLQSISRMGIWAYESEISIVSVIALFPNMYHTADLSSLISGA